MVNSGENTPWQTGRFAEYQNAGPGAAVSTANRAQLTDEEATGFTAATYLAGTDGWNPVAEPAEDVAPAAVVEPHRHGRKTARLRLAWNDSSEADVVRLPRLPRRDTADVPVDEAHLIAEVEKASSRRDRCRQQHHAPPYRVVAVDPRGQRIGRLGMSSRRPRSCRRSLPTSPSRRTARVTTPRCRQHLRRSRGNRRRPHRDRRRTRHLPRSRQLAPAPTC